MESVVHCNLEVKDAFSKLHPLSGVRNSVVKATLCQSKHLKHKVSTIKYAIFCTFTYSMWIIQAKKSILAYLCCNSNPALI